MKTTTKVRIIGFIIIFVLISLSQWTWGHLQSKDLRLIMNIISAIVIGVGVGVAITPFAKW